MKPAKQSSVLFIDRTNFENLQGKETNIADIVNFLTGRKELAAASELTKLFLIHLNITLIKVLFDDWHYSWFEGRLTQQIGTDTNLDYIKDNVKRFLAGDCAGSDLPFPVCEGSGSSKKYYEIIVHGDAENTHLLVVVENGIIDTLTTTKDALLRFILDSLGHLYKFGSDLEFLMYKYLNYKLNDGAFTLAKLRFE